MIDCLGFAFDLSDEADLRFLDLWMFCIADPEFDAFVNILVLLGLDSWGLEIGGFDVKVFFFFLCIIILFPA